MDYETATVATEAEMTNMEISESDNQFYDAIIPSWHGEFCDNIPNYLFCQFQKRPKATMNKTENTVQPPVTEDQKSWVQKTFHINKNLLPLKLTLFFFSASAFSILPYLTIHMKDIGISVEHIALMYAVLPFTIFFAPPLVGFMADKLGSYTRVLILTLFGSGVFHTVLLFLPSIIEVELQPSSSTFAFEGNLTHFSWSGCEGAAEDLCPQFRDSLSLMELDGCTMECPIQFGICEAVNPMFLCQANGTRVTFRELNVTTLIPENSEDCRYSLDAYFTLFNGKAFEVGPGCKLECSKIVSKFATCSYIDGNRMLTNILYFIFRMLATMCLACNFVLLHAQTIQMCKVEEERGNTGALGRQYVYEALAQAIISPSVGKLMDHISKQTDGQPNYYVPFMGQNVFLIICIITVFCIKMDLDLPKSSGMKGVKKIFTNLDICFFLGVMFVLGNCFGFVETFLFMYLKDEMNAPMYLLGLTITTGAFVSIPFLYVSDWIVGKMGNENVFITAFVMYAIRYVGYSYISSPWMAFPFEALEVFTYQLKKVATSRYVGENAPEGLLATLNGISGGLHYGFGKGTGGLIGGAIIASTGSIALAFRYFGVAAAIFGLIYFLYQYFYAGGFALFYRAELQKKKTEDKTLETLEPFLANEKPIIKEKSDV